MPPRRPSPPPPPPRPVPPPRRSSAGVGSLVGADALAPILAPWTPDPEDQAFVARCIASEGPTHHRVASAALLRLLALALEAAGGARAPSRPDEGGFPVPFRLPPHLDRQADEDAQYPVRLSRRALERLAAPGSPELAALADALTDGPAHHALANVAMVNLIDALLDRLESKGAGPAEGG